jgi:hypothetical protein
MLKFARIPEKDILNTLLDDLHDAESRSAAYQMVCRALSGAGFTGNMFVSRVAGVGWAEDVTETSYPEAWVQHYLASGYPRTDPTRHRRVARAFFPLPAVQSHGPALRPVQSPAGGAQGAGRGP